MTRGFVYVTLAALLCGSASAGTLALSKSEMVALTKEWNGPRYPSGRPKVPNKILERMEEVTLEEAWGVLRGHGYTHQSEGNWEVLHPDRPVVGRALTAQYMPSRPDYNSHIDSLGEEQGRIGASNSWPIDELKEGDVYVADGYGKIEDGTLIGDNLANAIYANSGNGVVFNGSSRDLEGIKEIDGFNAFVRGWHPSAIQDMVLGGLNKPIRIGKVTVLPGDVVLAKEEGVMFIPPHLAEEVVVRSEVIRLKDRFGHQRLREGKYTPGQIDGSWSEAIRTDFLRWFENLEEKPGISIEQLKDQL